MTNQELIKKAQKKMIRIKKQRRDLRYIKTLGKLRREGLLDVRDVAEYRCQVFLNEALWAAKLEPRILELLPALLARRPKVFVCLDVPQELELVVRELRVGRAKTPYQGIPAQNYERWMDLVGHNKLRPKIMRSFRLSTAAIAILETLAKNQNTSQSAIIQQALSALVRD